MLKKSITGIVAVAALTLSAGAVQAANAFANGGFEISGGGDQAQGWASAPGTGGYTRVCGGAGRTSDCAAQLMSPALNAAVALQDNVAAGQPALVSGTNPLFSFWAKGYEGDTGVLNYKLSYLSDIGGILSTSNEQGIVLNDDRNIWTQYSFDLGIVPVGANAAFIEFSQAIGPIGFDPPSGGTYEGGTVFIDDVNLEVAAVPVPAAVWLFGSGLLGLIGVARRKKAA